MNKLVNKFLSARDKFMPEMHLKEPEFTYSTCGPFTKNKERIKKFKETGDTNYIYKKHLLKLDFNMIWLMKILKILQVRAASDKVLRDKAFNNAKISRYDGYQRELASIIYRFFDKKSKGSGVTNIEVNPG